ncbi:hypothetical protein BCF33_1021 [Hasllibacter halocynthiae]|uniref:Secreted protein n=1 Tax=Hasllibacter halocynthiae TaxID=595589 RepID=A0A2T0X8Y0_9RHOB|nr:DUF1223 domain-containing protein [Hasllibacter halocynthiae]PRY95402.1 hypothetical protein BCF33_1021 [Hasllibacter halocynthiae]
MRRIALIATLCAALAPSARADVPVVVELYTSQGCNACPPADAMLAELGRDPDIVALALHVDYWDYIGWEDRFALPANGDRQRAYAHAHGGQMVYTPQMIVNGTHAVAGNRPGEVMAAIRAAAAEASPVALDAEASGGTLRVTAHGGQGRYRLHMARVDPGRTVAILEGENAGHTLGYSNIVTSFETLGAWDAAEPLVHEMPLPEGRVVLLLQEPGPGRIVAAAVAG